MLTEVISNQSPNLKILYLDKSQFSSSSTEKLLTKIAECDLCSSLEEIYLNETANFDSDISVEKFADILAIAPELKKFDIRDQ